MCMNVFFACMSVHHMCLLPSEARGGTGSPGATVKSGYEQRYGYKKQNQSSLEVQPVSLTTEPPPHIPTVVFEVLGNQSQGVFAPIKHVISH